MFFPEGQVRVSGSDSPQDPSTGRVVADAATDLLLQFLNEKCDTPRIKQSGSVAGHGAILGRQITVG